MRCKKQMSYYIFLRTRHEESTRDTSLNCVWPLIICNFLHRFWPINLITRVQSAKIKKLTLHFARWVHINILWEIFVAEWNENKQRWSLRKVTISKQLSYFSRWKEQEQVHYDSEFLWRAWRAFDFKRWGQQKYLRVFRYMSYFAKLCNGYPVIGKSTSAAVFVSGLSSIYLGNSDYWNLLSTNTMSNGQV